MKSQLNGAEPSAKQIRIYYQEIMDLNGIKDARRLQIGQKLQMPTISPMKINLPSGVTNSVTPPPAKINTETLETYMSTTIIPPKNATVPQSYTLPDEYKQVHTEYAGLKGVKIGEQWFDFDNEGRITQVFDREPNRLNDEFCGKSVNISYDNTGDIEYYYRSEYNDQGQITGAIKYNAQGNVTKFVQYSDWNAAGLPQCVDWFNSEGIFYQREIEQYDDSNQKVSTGLYNSDCSFYSLITYENGKQVQNLYISTDNSGNKHIGRYTDLDENINMYATGAEYNLEGLRLGDYFWGNYQYDALGRNIGYTSYNQDGTFKSQFVREYAADGSYKDMSYDANGNLTDVFWSAN